MLVSNAEFFWPSCRRAATKPVPGGMTKAGAGASMPRPACPPSGSAIPIEPEQLQLRLMTEQVPMPWDWPVEVNQLEAAAFCRWKADQTGLPVQLPSEGSGCCCGNNWPAISRTG